MFKIRLYLFLSKVIPYFKKKMEKTMMSYIDTNVLSYLQKFKTDGFEISKGTIIVSSANYNKIEFKIQYQDIEFHIYLENISNTIDTSYYFPILAGKRIDHIQSIIKLYEYFTKIKEQPEPLVSYFGYLSKNNSKNH